MNRSPRGVSGRALWCFLTAGIGLSLLAVLATPTARSFLFDTLGLVAAGGAVYGITRNEPGSRGAWRLVALAVLLFAAGDVVFDITQRGFGRPAGFPFADLVYLPAYPILAIALFQLARNRFNRETAIDSAVVAVALSAVIWVWAITPVLKSAGGATLERMLSISYPTMDILLVVVIVYAVFTLSRWTPAAWLLFVALGVLLVADASYARLVAEGASADGGALDVLWPIGYFLLAGAMMHPSMATLWTRGEAELVRRERARIVVLATALFAAPTVMLVDRSGTGPTIALAAVAAVTAAGVSWRVSRLVDDSNRARVALGESEARLRALVQHAADVIIVLSPSGRVKYASPAIFDIFTGAPENLGGSSFVDYLDAHGVEQGGELYRSLTADPGRPVTKEFHVFDGRSWRWIESTWTNQLDEPTVRGIVGNLRDITARKLHAAFGHAETRILEMILSGAPVPETVAALVDALEAFIPDAVGTIQLLDPDTGELAWAAAPGLSPEFLAELAERTTVDDIEQSLSATDLHVMRDIAAEGRRPEIIELCLAHGMLGAWSIPIRTPDGSELIGLLGLMLRAVRDPKPGELAVMERVRDLVAVAIDRDAHARQLGHLALHDPLTGLPNRALAQDRLEHALSRLADDAYVGSEGAAVAVLFIDLDRFKLVNDGLGHEAGDELLVSVSDRLRATVRRQDTIARLGGDEFVVLCEDLTDERHAEELAKRAAQALVEPFTLTHAEVTVSASIGVAVTSDSRYRASDLLHDADAAMYRAKRRGGARHELFDEAMHTQAASRLLTERALRSALEHDELRVLFQPQFDVASGAPVALEALLRWDHPARGLVKPGDFLKVAEETGVIVPIGEWVLRRACELARTSNGGGAKDGTLAVSTNVSYRQLHRADFPALVACVVREYAIDPATLCLEIAERALLDDLDATSEALRALKDLGVQLAIDDFGTGGSSLTYLRRFPFDELKVDRMFIEGLGRSAADNAIVAATIDMAHAIGMIVAAEGVETEEQLLLLRDLGCDRAQGYHLAAPEEILAPRLVLVEQQPA